jgi:hypothetical protein
MSGTRSTRQRLLLWALILFIGGVFAYRLIDAAGCSRAMERATSVAGSVSRAGLWVVPDETADREALSRLADFDRLPVFDRGVYVQQSSAERVPFSKVDRASLRAQGNRDMNNFVCVSDQAERVEQRGTPIVSDLERCPESYVRGYVLSRFEGSGRLARLWITTSNAFNLFNRDELLRVYVDEGPRPFIQVPLIDALYGRAHAIFAAPFGAGSRFYLAWYYPVVFGSKLIIALDRLRLSESYYHQTDVVLDRVPTPRKAAPKRLDLRDTAAATLKGRAAAYTSKHRRALEVPAGGQITAFELQGASTIEKVSVIVTEPETLSHVHLRVYWDQGGDASRDQPSIDLPLLALFASELALPSRSSLVLGTSPNDNQSRSKLLWLKLPMPFKSKSLWVLENTGRSNAQVDLTLDVANALPRGAWGYLTAQYYETKGPTQVGYHPLAKVIGPGRLVGVCLSMEGHGIGSVELNFDPYNFLEGDERALIDGKLAIAGTGTEDYFNNAFYFADGDFATAFAQAVKDPPLPEGQIAACRWHLLTDAIDFTDALDMAIEIGPAEPSLLDRYRSVAFIYR